MLETEVIKLLIYNNNYKEYRNYINLEDFSKETSSIVETIDNWFLTNTEDLEVSDLSNLVFSSGVSEKTRDYYEELFTNLAKPVTEVNKKTGLELLESFKQTKVLRDISTVAYEASRGYKEVSEVLALIEDLKSPVSLVDDKFEFVTDDITELLKSVKEPGLRWRLGTLNKMMGSLRKGNFGVIQARPETGKTTFLASEMTFMASQVKEGAGPVLWLNNEEEGRNVKLRCYCAALNTDLISIMRDPARAEKEYLKRTKGNLKMVDEANLTKSMIEKLCERYKPSLIVFDQIDKIKGFKADREDLMLGQLYQWARELAKIYGPVIGVCQASGEAEGVQWLEMKHMNNSKTSKAAEADWILGIGRRLDPGYENQRFLHLAKNKLAGDEDTDPTMRHGKETVLIDAVKARYRDFN